MLKSKKLLELCSNSEALNKLYHVAHKKVEQWEPSQGKAVKPDKNNAYKFELFIHNFLPFCQDGKVGALKVTREEEFAPVKNANPKDDSLGVDTPRQARHFILKQHRKWINKIARIPPKIDAEVDLLLSYEGEGQKLVEVIDGLDIDSGTDKLYITQSTQNQIRRSTTKDKPSKSLEFKEDDTFSFRSFYFNYAKFHSNPVNIWIHIFGIPLIAASLFGMIDQAGWTLVVDPAKVNTFELPISVGNNEGYEAAGTIFKMDFSMLLLVGVQIPYFICDPLIAIFAFIEGIVSLAIVKNMNQQDGLPGSPFGGEIMKFWIGIHIFGWVAQFLGHGFFEERAPAILTNVLLFWVAGFFQAFDVMNYVFGYRNEEKKELDKFVFAEIDEYRKKAGKPPLKRD